SGLPIASPRPEAPLICLVLARIYWSLAVERRPTSTRDPMRRIALAALLLAFASPCARATAVEDAARGLVQRVVPSHAAEIDVQEIPAGPDGADVFEAETRGGRLVLRGNSGVSIGSALGWYLANVAHLQASWDGDNLQLAGPLPPVPSKARVSSPYRCRAYLNYCTFNYTMSWWERARWER